MKNLQKNEKRILYWYMLMMNIKDEHKETNEKVLKIRRIKKKRKKDVGRTNNRNWIIENLMEEMDIQ